jgi:NAD(P)-dependent dehydrogenase (short-subunit alcohol dehydrogenase family)
MGEAISRDLVSRGWKVAMADIHPNTDLSEELGDEAMFVKCDVADYDSQAEMFQKVWDQYGRLDALCANAGIVDRSSIFIFDHRGKDSIPPKPDLSCTDVDYKGVIYGTQLAIHFMRKNSPPGGRIVATASCAALYPHETYPEYDGAKAAVMNFVRATSRVLKIKEQILINAVLPGIVHTKIIPPEMIAAVSKEYLTPVNNIVSAYNRFLNDETGMAGQALECSVEKQLFAKVPDYLDGPASRRACTVWDPLFKMIHHEPSELPDALP